jgi:type IV pilus assembly protein PilE
MGSKKAGFTLTEVLMTVIVLGVLASLAVPVYTTALEQSRSNEALANLNVIYSAEQIYLLNNNTFWPAGAMDNVIADMNTNLNIGLSTQYYTISVTANAGTGAAATFSATASRGNAGNKQFVINQTDVITQSGSY